MALKLPLGNFARSRRDFAVEGLRYSSASSNGTGNNFTVIYSLNNNSMDGSALAVYGLLGWYTSARQMMCAWPEQNLAGADFGNNIMLKPDMGAIGGYVSVGNNTSVGQPTQGLVFKADGSTWMTNFDAPLFILPVGWRLAVIAWEPIGLYAGNTLSAMTFLYGNYATARISRG